MARKNRREAHEPLNPAQVDLDYEPTKVQLRLETREERDRRLELEFGRRRARNDKRTDERVAAALDWSTCCIPGCGKDLRVPSPPPHLAARLRRTPDVSERLPLCTRHEAIIAKQVQAYWNDPDVLDMRERLARQRVEAEIRRAKQHDVVEENGGHEQGQIYFIRINDLIKVGWSSKLRSRIKAYGASAEVLCHYPATRQEETDLHRQLRPYLAKGREWYQDCKLIADVAAGIVERHGSPSILPYWTEPKADLTARPKGYPAA